MKVLIAGATGTLGRPVVKMLVAHGHEVVGLTRREAKRQMLESMGARAVIGDALNGEEMRRIVREVAPTHVAHLLTALPAGGPLRPAQLKPTNELRTRGTANLLEASVAAGVKRVVLESFLGVYGTTPNHQLATEQDPLPAVPEHTLWHDTLLALRSLENQAAQAARSGAIETVVLRFGLFYGPDVPTSVDLAKRLRARQVFVPKNANGVGSFIHIDDAAAATVTALERTPATTGIYNIVDDDPVGIAEFVSITARAAAAPPPRTAPAWLVRMVAPIVASMASNRLMLSNDKARRELGWRPGHRSMRDGFEVAA